MIILYVLLNIYLIQILLDSNTTSTCFNTESSLYYNREIVFTVLQLSGPDLSLTLGISGEFKVRE